MTDAAAPDRATVSVDAKTVAFAALFLLGGSGTGLATSRFGDDDVKVQIGVLAAKVDALTRSVDSLTSLTARVEDHEGRLRSIERGKP